MLLTLIALSTAPVVQDCRTITDAVARLACYDAQDRPSERKQTPARPTMSAPDPVQVATPTPPRRNEELVSRKKVGSRTGHIVAVEPLRYGYHRVTLDDGRSFDTATNTAAPPAVGSAVRFRRSLIGTTFMDIDGRDPITVRPVRRPG